MTRMLCFGLLAPWHHAVAVAVQVLVFPYYFSRWPRGAGGG